MIDCTVIVPTHFWNSELSEKINQLIEQGLTVRVVCDGLLTPEVNSHKRLSFFSTAKKVGPNIARNLALVNLTTKWVTFLDSDDYLNTVGLRALIDLEATKADLDINVICCDFEFKKTDIEPAFHKESSITLKNLDRPFKQLCQGTLPAVCWGRLYKSRIFNEERHHFSKSKKHGRDILFSRTLAVNIRTWVSANVLLVKSDKRTGSFSRTFTENNVRSAISLTLCSKAEKRHDKLLEVVGNLRHLKYITILACFRIGRYDEFLRSLQLIKRRTAKISMEREPRSCSRFVSLFIIKFICFCPILSWCGMKLVRKIYQPY